MFPRAALVILALLIVAIGGVFVRGMFVAQQARCIGGCERNIAQPYKMLIGHMRTLSEAGRTDELRKLIIQADEHSGDVSNVCSEPQKESYATEVYEWTR